MSYSYGLRKLATFARGAFAFMVVFSCAHTPHPDRGGAVSALRFDLSRVQHLASKGRVQDKLYNPDQPVIDEIVSAGLAAVPVLIDQLEDETEIQDPPLDYWHRMKMGDIAFVILMDLFSDSEHNPVSPELDWYVFLEAEGVKRNAEDALRAFLEERGRTGLKAKWQRIYDRHKEGIVWDPGESCFRIAKAKRDGSE